MEVRCQTSFCQNEDGFPKLLRACTVRLGIRSQPEYDGREFVKHGTEKCVVTVYIGSSPHHVEWSVTAAGHRFKDTCQVVARKALRTLCQIYEEEVADTPLRFLLPFQRNRLVWMARMRALEGQQLLEDDPTVVYLTAYLLTLDAHREVIVVEALKQAKDEHVQKLMEAYLVTHNQRRALRMQEPASSNLVQPMRAEDPQILE
ncbi:hypothetical protein ACJX0J_032457, partial [Zea mays]